jgi:hypothetical protein
VTHRIINEVTFLRTRGSKHLTSFCLESRIGFLRNRNGSKQALNHRALFCGIYHVSLVLFGWSSAGLKSAESWWAFSPAIRLVCSAGGFQPSTDHSAGMFERVAQRLQEKICTTRRNRKKDPDYIADLFFKHNCMQYSWFGRLAVWGKRRASGFPSQIRPCLVTHLKV